MCSAQALAAQFKITWIEVLSEAFQIYLASAVKDDKNIFVSLILLRIAHIAECRNEFGFIFANSFKKTEQIRIVRLLEDSELTNLCDTKFSRNIAMLVICKTDMMSAIGAALNIAYVFPLITCW